MLIIPLQSVPSQRVTVTLAGQYCQINVYQKLYGLFLDLYADNALLIGGVACQDRNPIVRSTYLGFIGDLVFFDRQGLENPAYAGLGSRFALAYLEAADLVAAA